APFAPRHLHAPFRTAQRNRAPDHPPSDSDHIRTVRITASLGHGLSLLAKRACWLSPPIYTLRLDLNHRSRREINPFSSAFRLSATIIISYYQASVPQA